MAVNEQRVSTTHGKPPVFGIRIVRTCLPLGNSRCLFHGISSHVHRSYYSVIVYCCFNPLEGTSFCDFFKQETFWKLMFLLVINQPLLIQCTPSQMGVGNYVVFLCLPRMPCGKVLPVHLVLKLHFTPAHRVFVVGRRGPSKN